MFFSLFSGDSVCFCLFVCLFSFLCFLFLCWGFVLFIYLLLLLFVFCFVCFLLLFVVDQRHITINTKNVLNASLNKIVSSFLPLLSSSQYLLSSSELNLSPVAWSYKIDFHYNIISYFSFQRLFHDWVQTCEYSPPTLFAKLIIQVVLSSITAHTRIVPELSTLF